MFIFNLHCFCFVYKPLFREKCIPYSYPPPHRPPPRFILVPSSWFFRCVYWFIQTNEKASSQSPNRWESILPVFSFQNTTLVLGSFSHFPFWLLYRIVATDGNDFATAVSGFCTLQILLCPCTIIKVINEGPDLVGKQYTEPLQFAWCRLIIIYYTAFATSLGSGIEAMVAKSIVIKSTLMK